LIAMFAAFLSHVRAGNPACLNPVHIRLAPTVQDAGQGCLQAPSGGSCIDNVDTPDYLSRMPSRRTPATTRQPTASIAAVEAAAPVDTKGSINLRIESGTRQLIDDAAAILGKTRTEFMIESARREAIDVLLDQRLFELSPERYEAFLQALDNPPAPGPKLRALLRRVPAWQK